MEWKNYSNNPQHAMDTCECSYGTWMISQIIGHDGYPAKIKLKPAKPADWSQKMFHTRMNALQQLSNEWTVEMEALFRYTDFHEVGFAQSINEARMLVELIDAGTQHLPSAHDQLLANDFVYQVRYDTVLYIHKRYKNLSLSMREDTVTVTYSTNRWTRWENIAYLSNVSETKLLPILWPDGMDDYKAVVAAHAISIMKQREARGGLFKKPL